MAVERISKSVWDEFVYGGHLLSLGAVSVAWVAVSCLSAHITWDGLLVVYLLVQPIYSYDRICGIEKDFLTNPQRTKHIARRFEVILLMIVIDIILFIGLLIYFNKIKNLIFGLIILILGFLYYKFFKQITRRIIAFKNFFVALFWVMFAIFLIIYYSFPLINFSIFLILLFIFIKTFIIQIFFDIKDIKTDQKDNLLTIPVVCGKNATIQIISICIILSVLPLLIGVQLKALPIYTLSLILIIPYDIYFFQKTKSAEKYSYYLLAPNMFYGLYLFCLVKIC